MAGEMLRKSKRQPLQTVMFSFSPDHKPAATRIKECRERRRILSAVRRTRGVHQEDTEEQGIGGKEGKENKENEGQVTETQGDDYQDQDKEFENQEFGNQEFENQGFGNQGFEDQGHEDQGHEDQGCANQEIQESGSEKRRQGQCVKRHLGYSKPKTGLIVKFRWNKK